MRTDRPAGCFSASEVVLVTGAASGIGRAAARLFAEEGAAVAVVDLRRSAAEATAEEIRNAGGTAIAIEADVAADDGAEAAVAAVVERFGRLDAAVNNAGISGPLVPTDEVLPEDFDCVQRVDLRGVWLCMRAEIRHFLAAGGGVIVNSSSVAGVVGNPLSASYSAAKHGVVGLTRTAAGEYGRLGIRINAVAPGLTRTPMVEQLSAERPEAMAALEAGIPLGRAAAPREIAEAVVWLASPRASFVHGHVLVADGGVTAL